MSHETHINLSTPLCSHSQLGLADARSAPTADDRGSRRSRCGRTRQEGGATDRRKGRERLSNWTFTLSCKMDVIEFHTVFIIYFVDSEILEAFYTFAVEICNANGSLNAYILHKSEFVCIFKCILNNQKFF